ncbi:hypothetical protein [Dehalogenimonas alkenigignens]|uniref:Uncharacterized protein n=1 Tax=Dehalogenimonas alkenigignens TaxID=1217799 RepID=A0A0W0GG64_9CHLR|nr:hypothetical protein [Dehalogenimonas alkenigignens]KTB47542.1 hypothetical protein DEALK_03870 [Dehalogenimonas alkenigignens]PVV83405.1 hypothetical protein DD509_06105 [Dehalogenimonas alkenigignens]
MKRLAPILLVALFILALFSVLPVSLSAADYELHDVMNGAVPGLSVVVNGSGQGYYGQSIRATFSNSTGAPLTVKVPIGLALLPQNAGVQTMYTAGAETISVPPGSSQSLIIAFCGEQHDSGPRSSDVFTAGGFATGSLLQTLRNINRAESFGSDAQAAVWHHTDGNDISSNDLAQDLAGGFGAAGAAAAAGLAGSALAGGTALLLNRIERGGGSAETEPAPWPEENEESMIASPEAIDDRIVPDYVPETLPPELRPPIEIAEIPPPEDPADGVMVAGGNLQDVIDDIKRAWDKYRELRDANRAEPPTTRPQIFESLTNKDPWDKRLSDWWENVKRHAPWGEGDPPEQVRRQTELEQEGGRRIRQGVFGSGAELTRALGQTPEQLIQQVEREVVADNGKAAIRFVRQANQLITPAVENVKGLPGNVTRDLSGAPLAVFDNRTPDAGAAAELLAGVKKDDAAHQAYAEFFQKHDGPPDRSNPAQVNEFMDMYNRIKSR